MGELDPASHCKHFQECRRSRGLLAATYIQWPHKLVDHQGEGHLGKGHQGHQGGVTKRIATKRRVTKRMVIKGRVTKTTKGRAAGVTTLSLPLPSF